MNEKIKPEDMGKAQRLTQLQMKKFVPILLTEQERTELSSLILEFNSKYNGWQNGFNFITGEIK